MEQWKDIKGYEGLYKISNHGRVKSLRRIIKGKGNGSVKNDRIKKANPNKRGYIRVNLCKRNKRLQHSVHRLVALAFIPNPENKPGVNHISGIKTDNRSVNLEWCTPSENLKHAYRIGLVPCTKGRPGVFGLKNNLSTHVKCSVSGEIMIHRDAANISGIKPRQFSEMIRGKILNTTTFILYELRGYKKKHLGELR